jgi:hypothetical protein
MSSFATSIATPEANPVHFAAFTAAIALLWLIPGRLRVTRAVRGNAT